MALAAPANHAPPQDPRSFREALGRFSTGVAFVTAAPDGEPTGLIVNSLASVSLEPPLVLFCPSRSSLTWCRMREAGRLGVNVLGRQHERFAKRATPPGTDRFAGLDWETGRDGVPLLTDALASFEFETIAEHPTGDHWIVVGQVDNLRISPAKDPLIFFAGTLHAMQQGTRRHLGHPTAAAPPTSHQRQADRPGPSSMSLAAQPAIPEARRQS